MEYFVHGSIALTTGKIRVLILGGGDGGVLTEVLKYDSVTQVTLVEIDEEVINICQKYSPTGNAESMGDAIELLIGDAMDYLAYTKDTFDLILCDIPDGYMGYYIEDGPVTKVTFAKLLEGAGRVLNPDGVLATLYTDEKGPSHYVPTFRRANSVTLDDHNGFFIATKRDSDMRVPLREPVEGLSFYSHEKHSERFFGMDFTEDCRQEYIQWLESKLPAENEKKADEARVKVEKLRQDLAEAEAELKMAVKKTKTVPQKKSSGKAKSATTSAAMPCFAGISLKRNGGKFTLGSANIFEKQSKFTRPVKVQTGTYLGGSYLSGTSRRGGAVGSGWNSSSRSAAGQSDLKRSDTPRSRPGSRCGSRPGTPAKTRTSDTPAVKTGAAATGKVDCSRFQTPERMPSRPATPRGSPYVTPVKSRPSSRSASPGPVTYNLHGHPIRSNSLVRSDSEGEQGGGVTGKMGAMNPPRAKKGANLF